MLCPFTFQMICYGTECIYGIPWEECCMFIESFWAWTNSPLITWTKIIQPMVFTMYPNEIILFLLRFVGATQYLSKFQKIWYGAQTISRILRMGYYMFIEYFALWTWIQHALNAFKLNWCFILLWISIWFPIPPSWKTLSNWLSIWFTLTP